MGTSEPHDIRTLPKHSAHPDRITVVVEQPPGERYRLDFHPEDGTFHRTSSLSLFFDRGFSGAYGWVAGMGTPPDPHLDVILVTRRSSLPGDLMEALPCGAFLRNDGDHKLVAIDVTLWDRETPPDLFQLDEPTQREVQALYPRADPGEGWRGRGDAIALLGRQPTAT